MLELKKKKDKKIPASPGFSQNPKVLEVNLIKGEARTDFNWRKNLGSLLFALIIVALFVTEIYLGLNWWASYESQRLTQTENNFNQVSREINSMKAESDQVSAFKTRANLADSLVKDHIYWSKFFDWLEKNTLSSVHYLGFSGKTDGVYNLQAQASSFRDISWQVRALLEDPRVIKVYSDSGSSAREDREAVNPASSVSFDLYLQVDPSLFTSQTSK